MIYLFCPRPSDGARQLVEYINKNGGRCRRVRTWPPKARLRALGDPRIDVLVNWGGGGLTGLSVPSVVLNKHVVHNKFYELEKLRAEGVTVPDFSKTRPSGTGWLARVSNHTEAKDLLSGRTVGDYYTLYTPTEKEFRIHVWKGVSLRAGIKVPRTASPHPKFRSWTAGWKLDYGNVCQAAMRQRYREIAKNATAALGYDFGAVDIGITPSGNPVVFEVNSAPGLEGNTVSAYGDKLIALSRR